MDRPEGGGGADLFTGGAKADDLTGGGAVAPAATPLRTPVGTGTSYQRVGAKPPWVKAPAPDLSKRTGAISYRHHKQFQDGLIS